MDIDILRTELTDDPLGRGYEALLSEAVAANMNAIDRTTKKTIMEATEVFNAIDETEFNALSVDNQNRIWNVLHMGAINPFGLEASLFTNAFGGASATITALQAARKNNVSRGVELGLGIVRAGHIEEARRG